MSIEMVGDAGLWPAEGGTIMSVAWTWVDCDAPPWPAWWYVKVTVDELGWSIDVRHPSGGHIRGTPALGEPRTYRTLGRTLREIADLVTEPEVSSLLTTLSAVEHAAYADEVAVPGCFRGRKYEEYWT